MSHLKSFLIISLFSIISINAFSQVDTTEIDDDKDTTAQIVQINKIIPHTRGVYKTYEEYINNSPSVDAEFALTPLQISKKSSLIAEAYVDWKGKRPKKIWGLSDGEHVYIRVLVNNVFDNHYFRLQCDGPRPYIYRVEKTVFVSSGLGLLVMASVAATSAALPPFVSLFLVKDYKHLKPVMMATNNKVKSYLKDYPDLLEAYEKEPKHNKATKAKYLTDYNNRKLGK